MDFRQTAIELAKQTRCQQLAEIGVWEGELSSRLYELSKQLTLVDPYRVEWNNFQYRDEAYTCTMGGHLRTQQELDEMFNVLQAKLPEARFLRMPSTEAAVWVEDHSLDFVFIDSVHTYEHCKADIEAWLPKIRSGGILSGDDYVPDHEAVARAVDEAFGQKPRDRVWWERVD